MKLNNILIIIIFSLIISTGLYLKILGSTNIPIDVEKNGYCKQYGEEWKNKIGLNYCYHKYKIVEKIHFTEEEFRDHCPKHKFISLKLNSDCFYQSGSIS